MCACVCVCDGLEGGKLATEYVQGRVDKRPESLRRPRGYTPLRAARRVSGGVLCNWLHNKAFTVQLRIKKLNKTSLRINLLQRLGVSVSGRVLHENKQTQRPDRCGWAGARFICNFVFTFAY